MRLLVIVVVVSLFGLLYAGQEPFVFDRAALQRSTERATTIEHTKQLVGLQLRLALYVAERTEFCGDGDFFSINWAGETCYNKPCRNKRFLCWHERARAAGAVASSRSLTAIYEQCFSGAEKAPSRESICSDSQLLRWVYEKISDPTRSLQCTKRECNKMRRCSHMRAFEQSMFDAWDEKGLSLFVISLLQIGQAHAGEVVAALERVHDFLSSLAPLGLLDEDALQSGGSDWRIAYSRRLLAYNWHAFAALFNLNWLEGTSRFTCNGDKQSLAGVDLYGNKRSYPYRQHLLPDQERKSNRIVREALATMCAARNDVEGGDDGRAARARLGLIDCVTVDDDSA